MINWICLTIFLMNFSISALAVEADSPLYVEPPELLKLNELVQLKPLDNFHINLDAPNACGEKGKLIKVMSDQLICQAAAPGEDQYSIYICDDNNTFCKRQHVNIKTESPKNFWAWVKYYWVVYINKDYWDSPTKIDKSPNDAAKGFIHNDEKNAFAMAKKESKPVLLFYTQKYCSPCRFVKETSLVTDDFQKWAKNFVLLQIDADVDKSGELINQLNLARTPTFVLLNSDGVELDRFIGYASPTFFQTWFESVKQNTPVGEIEQRFVKGKAISSDQKSQLLYWYLMSYRESDAETLYKKYSEYFLTAEPLISKLLRYTGPGLSGKPLTQGDINDQLDFADDFVSDITSCTGLKSKKGFTFLGSISEKHKSMNTKQLRRLEGLFVKLSKRYGNPLLVGKPKGADCFLKQIYVQMYLQSFYELTNDKREQLLSKKIHSMLDNFPLSAGAKIDTSVQLYKSFTVKKEERVKMLANLAKDNQSDFTYDYISAVNVFGNEESPNYEQALASVNKALVKSKGRIWEKAIKLKVKLLIKMKRYTDARRVIDLSLEKISLPTNHNKLIHKFVQSMRGLERDLKKASQSSKGGAFNLQSGG